MDAVEGEVSMNQAYGIGVAGQDFGEQPVPSERSTDIGNR